MAFIKKRGSKKELVRDVPMPIVAKDPEQQGALRFEVHVGDFVVSLSEKERSIIVSSWSRTASLHD